jgi:hypothetical protein
MRRLVLVGLSMLCAAVVAEVMTEAAAEPVA